MRKGSDIYEDFRKQLLEIEALQDENNGLKEALSDILKQDLAPEMLDQLEMYQTLLLNKDMTLSLMRHEIAQNRGTGSWPAKQRMHDDIQAMGREIKGMHQNISALKTSALSMRQGSL